MMTLAWDEWSSMMRTEQIFYYKPDKKLNDQNPFSCPSNSVNLGNGKKCAIRTCRQRNRARAATDPDSPILPAYVALLFASNRVKADWTASANFPGR